MNASQVNRLGFYSAAEFVAWLRNEAPLHDLVEPEVKIRKGFRVTRKRANLTEEERKRREETVLKTMSDAMKKRRPK